jgi:hypothetical protein
MVSDFDAEFRDGCEDLAAAVREEQLGEINVLKRTWFPIANAPGSVDDRGIGAQNAMRALTALDKFVKLQIQQAKLVGANSPERVESTLQGPGGGPVQTSSVDLSKLDTASLLELQAIMQRASSVEGDAQD